MKLYNSLTRQIEEFSPIYPSKVGVYTCGPTVYDYITIGNWRTYMLGDILVRVLTYLYPKYQIDYIMNITDVGHLTGDNLGDADFGEDRIEKAARREHKTAWDIAKFYTDDFLVNYTKLNLTKPRLFTKATDHIPEQIDLVKKIEAKGFAYKINDGIYFNVAAWEKAGNKYGELSNLDQIKTGARVEPNPDKKDPRDFALWKFSPNPPAGGKRQMEWESPWGKGFPGWHIECSAMSMKYLGEQFDIHVGGEDLRSTHHPNEIVQSEAASGKIPFVKYWVHGAFLQVNGGRMGKSLGNAFTLTDIIKKGFDPLALRYFYLTGHYRRPLNFTWEGLEAAQRAYKELVNYIGNIKNKEGPLSIQAQGYDHGFSYDIENDLLMPQALAQVWMMIKDKRLEDYEKYQLLMEWDKILGLDLNKVDKVERSRVKVDEGIKLLIKKREKLRKEKKWQEADEIRKIIEVKGYQIEDTTKGTVIKKVERSRLK